MINTYTDHPAYQIPISRSSRAVKFRYYFGISLGLTSWATIFLAGVILALQMCDAIKLFYETNQFHYFLVQYLPGILVNILILMSAKTAIPWCRHLTRPNSREYV